ncbi:MAG: formylglycine-generating enzyme family protein [Burkholderiales bacterium]|nr:formylglycine-generating enzyme family protein [Anaerolineae bacterium]
MQRKTTSVYLFLIAAVSIFVLLTGCGSANTSTPTARPTRRVFTAVPPTELVLPATRVVTPPDVAAPDTITANSDWTPVIESFDAVEMALVPPGCFMMGSTDEHVFYARSLFNYQWRSLYLAEQPAHEICFDASFWIDRYEVTNAQFASFEGNAAEPSRSEDANHPRTHINWFEAYDFCALRGMRLPTEAEWEYAARGPDALIFPWGDTFIADNAFSDDTAELPNVVGSRPGGSSWVGAHDLSANVGEWVSSDFEDYPYDAADGRENVEGAFILRVIRGGDWEGSPAFARAAFRSYQNPNAKGQWRGFRCARTF